MSTEPSTKVISLRYRSERALRSPASHGNAGRSLLELIIVVAMISLILGAGISRMSSGMYGAETSARELTANLRLCRSQAVGSGYHYRVNVAAGSYAINRMVPGAGNAWVVDATTPTRTVTLPRSVTVSQGTGAYEFDSRGTTVGATLLATVRLHDAGTGNDVDVKVWPSGQVF